MFTVEIKINGTMIKHIYGLNVSGRYECEYDVDIYDVQTRTVNHHKVTHNRSYGITKLIQLILEEELKEEE